MAARIVSLVQQHAAAEPDALLPAADPGAPSGAPLGAPLGRPLNVPQGLQRPGSMQPGQHVWRGASGRLYAHQVYGLIECPPLPPAGYLLVRCDAEGRRTPLRIGVAVSDAPTLNLAEIRRFGAQAGANEVHVRFDREDAERRLVACDLRAGLLGTLAAAASLRPD